MCKVPAHYEEMSASTMKKFIQELLDDAFRPEAKRKLTAWEYTFLRELKNGSATWVVASDTPETKIIHPLSKKQLQTLRELEMKIYV